MKILLINQNWFKEELKEDGDEVYSVGVGPQFDYNIKSYQHINEIIRSFPNNFVPDRIVVLDNSAPIYIAGLESIDIPTLFYSVDVHQHYLLHKSLYNVFDAMYVAMKDYVPKLQEEGCPNVKWLPLWASRLTEPSNEKKYNAVFVGTLNSALNPDRVKFFDELKNKTDILCMQGEWFKIFPHSKMIVNQTVKGDLNFRVFEAMGTGSLLLTEKSANGLFDLFEDKKHLVTYEKGNVDEAKDLINYYMVHEQEASEIAYRGREEILNKHLARHRVNVLKESLKNLTIQRNKDLANLAMGENYYEIFICIKKNNIDFANFMLGQAMRYFQKVNYENVKLSSEFLEIILSCCINHDYTFHQKVGAKLVSEIASKYNYIGLHFYNVWNLLNYGNFQKIQTVYPNFNSKEIFPLINKFVTSFML